ncbi:hypothetical protein SO802_010179 [Lithocarpus litseifolius]|uniref:Uncharacterized protein n=1 Tax=Lithocarpus litseifolius TaxID=425828 RepID=A0AAW2DDK4_9ROSI
MEGGMGFRDLRDFNLAMSAKQGWRMIQWRDSLLYKFFKARYFPQFSFLDAKESPGCSYVWRSLMAALPILRLGYCWRVGNGSSISVVGDRWIPNHPTNTIIHPRQELVGELVVLELIDPELHAWRIDMIMSLFHKNDAEAICRIPLSRRSISDSIIWLHNKNEELLQEFKQAQAQLTVSWIEQTSSEVWQPPPLDVYKLNFDAAMFLGLRRTGIGAIIRIDKGEVMAAM